MPSTYFKTKPTWEDSNRITYGLEEDIILTNSGDLPIFFEITTNNTTPTIPVVHAHRVNPGDYRAMTMAAGERLWLGGKHGSATVS